MQHQAQDIHSKAQRHSTILHQSSDLAEKSYTTSLHHCSIQTPKITTSPSFFQKAVCVFKRSQESVSQSLLEKRPLKTKKQDGDIYFSNIISGVDSLFFSPIANPITTTQPGASQLKNISETLTISKDCIIQYNSKNDELDLRANKNKTSTLTTPCIVRSVAQPHNSNSGLGAVTASIPQNGNTFCIHTHMNKSNPLVAPTSIDTISTSRQTLVSTPGCNFDDHEMLKTHSSLNYVSQVQSLCDPMQKSLLLSPKYPSGSHSLDSIHGKLKLKTRKLDAIFAGENAPLSDFSTYSLESGSTNNSVNSSKYLDVSGTSQTLSGVTEHFESGRCLSHISSFNSIHCQNNDSNHDCHIGIKSISSSPKTSSSHRPIALSRLSFNSLFEAGKDASTSEAATSKPKTTSIVLVKTNRWIRQKILNKGLHEQVHLQVPREWKKEKKPRKLVSSISSSGSSSNDSIVNRFAENSVDQQGPTLLLTPSIGRNRSIEVRREMGDREMASKGSSSTSSINTSIFGFITNYFSPRRRAVTCDLQPDSLNSDSIPQFSSKLSLHAPLITINNTHNNGKHKDSSANENIKSVSESPITFNSKVSPVITDKASTESATDHSNLVVKHNQSIPKFNIKTTKCTLTKSSSKTAIATSIPSILCTPTTLKTIPLLQKVGDQSIGTLVGQSENSNIKQIPLQSTQPTQKLDEFETLKSDNKIQLSVSTTTPHYRVTSAFEHHPTQTYTNINSISDLYFLRKLASGGFADVYLARKRVPLTCHYFALKAVRKKDIVKKKMVRQVLAEKDILESVHHGFIVELLHTFQTKTTLFFCMEYVHGGDLYQMLKQLGSLTEKQAVFYAAEVVVVFEYLHSLHIVYRDLKPENILLDSTGHIKLADFGFAKKITSTTKSFCGTPDYMAPEIIISRPYSFAVDWWSLGILIFELVAGKTPFRGFSIDEIYNNVIQGNIQWSTKVFGKLKKLVTSLLTPDPTLRLGSVNDAKDIKAHPWFNSIYWETVSSRGLVPPTKTFNFPSNMTEKYEDGNDGVIDALMVEEVTTSSDVLPLPMF
ncbi:hypothetical protein QVD99_006230 [Batrachochytrium dendrobatidis]|nr:hypothetical protein O5D80_003427 [Batrachochytrium dendrobatidis]KAK5667011.1 hypothetical protein QVD99_006230 [Batrachochytrium dendrobatidis]